MRYVIPLTPEPQRFSIVLAGRELLLAVRWMDAPEGGWLLDMADAEGVPLASRHRILSLLCNLQPFTVPSAAHLADCISTRLSPSRILCARMTALTSASSV